MDFRKTTFLIKLNNIEFNNKIEFKAPLASIVEMLYFDLEKRWPSNSFMNEALK